ncbi:MAG TPA: GAF domain-containing protein, partial [Phototrophicaceae bacterium]|nr:GAF domain-containing protein [Phototrophicaceae bacterium]
MFTGLRNRLTLIFIGLSVIPLILLGLTINQISSQSLENQALNLQEEISKGVAIRITNFFSERESELRFLIDYDGLATVRPAAQKELLDNLLSYQTAYQQLSLLDNQGQEFVRVSRVDVAANAGLADFSQEAAFLEPSRSGEIYFSPVQFDETVLEPLISIAIPITDLRSGEISQILVAQLRFQAIWDLIAGLDFTQDEDIYVLDAQNKVVAHRNPSIVLRETSFDAPEQNSRANGLSGNDVILALSPIQLSTQQFEVVAERNYAQATVLAAQLSTVSFLAVMVMLGIAVSLAFLLINQIVKPIKALGAVANAIQEGDLSRRAEAHERDEIGGLARAFNGMADQLQEFIGGLEAHVVERTRDLATTVEVGKLATSIYSQPVLLPKLVDFIRAQFNLYYTQIYLLDEAGKYAILRAGTGEVGQQLLVRNHRLDLEETSLVARAVQSGQPVLVTDTETSPIHKPNELLPLTRSEITIPLMVGNTTIGVLDMQADKAETFNQENRSVFEAMASQIASALRGTMAYDEAQAALYRAEAINQRLTAETWHSYLGVLGEEKALGYQYDLETPQPLSTPLPDAAQHQLVYPVRLRGQQIGRIVVREEDKRDWQPEELNLIEDVAQRVAQALDQYRAFDQIKQAEIEVRESAAELQTVAEVSAAAAATLNVDELLQIVSDLTKERFKLYHAHVYLLDDAGEKLILAAGAGEVGRTMKATGRSINVKHPHSLVARAAREHQGVIVNDVSREPDFLPHPLLPETRSEMAVPMIAAGQLVGVLDVQANAVDHFTIKDLQVQSTLAAQIAVAVQNGRAYARANQQATIIETSRDLIALVDLTGTAIYVNPGGAQLLGYDKPEDLIGKNISDTQTGDDLKQVMEVGIPTAMATGVWRGESKVVRQDGTYIPVDQTIFVVRNIQGEITNLATIISDATERKQAEAEREHLLTEAQQNAQLIRTVIDATPDWIFAKDQNYR